MDAVRYTTIRLYSGAAGYVLGFASALVLVELCSLYARRTWGLG